MFKFNHCKRRCILAYQLFSDCGKPFLLLPIYYSDFNLTVIYAQMKKMCTIFDYLIATASSRPNSHALSFFREEKYTKHSRYFTRRTNHHWNYLHTHQGHSQSFQSKREALCKLMTPFNVSYVTS